MSVGTSEQTGLGSTAVVGHKNLNETGLGLSWGYVYVWCGSSWGI